MTMALPPLLAGAVKLTVTCALPDIAAPIIGAPGTVAGVTLFDADDARLLPTAFVAFTLHVTATPLVRPTTVIGEPADVALCAPHVAV